MLIRTEKSDAIMNFLQKDFLINENIIGIIENLPWAEIYVDDVDKPTGVLVKKDGYMHLVYTENEGFIDNICENYFKEGFYGFSGVEGKLAEKIRQRYLLGWESRCTLYYMPRENFNISLKKNQTERIRLEDAETVDKFYQYRGPETLETIKRDITNRPSSAIYVDGEIVCWVLIHDDRSMGIMYTKEDYRRRGYAIDVTIDLAQQIIDMGKVPFIQIVQGNGMSPGLAKKCGFVEAGKADWFGIIAGKPKELIEANDRSRQQFLANMPKELHPLIYKDNEEYSALFNFLHNFKYQPPSVSGIVLAKVEDNSEKALWSDMTIRALNNGLEDLSSMESLLQAMSDPKYSLYLLYKDGIAVAASATQKDEEEDRGLYLLSVLPGYEDLMKTLICETIQYEKSHGCFFMTTQVADGSRQMFEELGFIQSHKI